MMNNRGPRGNINRDKKSPKQKKIKNRGKGASKTPDGGFSLNDNISIEESDMFLSDEYTVADTISSMDNTLSLDDNDSSNDQLDDPDGLAPSDIRQNKLLDVISLASTIPTEKQTKKREQYLRMLFKAITQYATPPSGTDTLIERWEPIILPSCLYVLRVGRSPEKYAACRCLESMALILGEGDEYFESVSDSLEKVVKSTGASPTVRSAALRASSMLCFVCSTDVAARVALFALCEDILKERFRGEEAPVALKAAALGCWALLGGTLEDEELAEDGGRCANVFEFLGGCLEVEELREGAGCCLCLIHEARLNLGYEGEEGATNRRFMRGSWDDSEWESQMHELQEEVSQLAQQSGHHMSKKAKKQQRSIFRDYQSTLVDDEPPEETINFRSGKSLTCHSWAKIIQLNFVRHCLQGGFQMHLMLNPVLHEIFDFEGVVEDEFEGGARQGLTQLEKRLYLSKASEKAKSKDKDMKKKRNNRANCKNHFITVDGEDI